MSIRRIDMPNRSLSERIAHLALDTFDSLPQKCKPRTLPNGRREWTPMSAMILNCRNDHYSYSSDAQSKDQDSLKVISLATGTKSIPISALTKCSGLVLHDCHAEILALRGLNYWLLCELERMLSDHSFKSDWLDMMTTTHDPSSASPHDSNSRLFTVKAGVEISLFSTTAPCGDASMELLIAAAQAAGQDISPWTPQCKEVIQQQRVLLDSNHLNVETLPPPGRGYFSQLGALRRKPARADAEISMSKSCTDKLMLKQFAGMLSFPTDLFIEPSIEEVYMKRLVLYYDQFDQSGYERAFAPGGRLNQVLQHEIQAKANFRPFEVAVLPERFRRFGFDRVNSMGEDGTAKCVTSNLSALWIAEGDKGKNLVEALVNGVKQGYRQFDHRSSKGSAVCRRNMVEKAMDISKLVQARNIVQSPWLNDFLMSTQYSVLKSLPVRQQGREVKNLVLEHLGGWPKKIADDHFIVALPSSSNQHENLQTCFNVSALFLLIM